MSLAEAQEARLDRVCQALELGPEDHLLEIGTGWGGLAVHAASRYGCRVTTTTISEEQRDGALRRVADAGVSDRVTVLLEDYRDLRGRYDKLVSIEMIEAVGWQYFDTYFRRCSDLLEPDGLMFLQAITIDDRAYDIEKAAKSFANTLIFPGGCLPSTEVIQRSVASETDMSTVWVDDISPHYAETIKRWRARFLRELRPGRRARIRRGVPARLDAVALDERGRLPGAAAARHADAVREAGAQRARGESASSRCPRVVGRRRL